MRQLWLEAPFGLDLFHLKNFIKQSKQAEAIIYIARDAQTCNQAHTALKFFAPNIESAIFPAWDCIPYDRVSPHPSLVAQRLSTMTKLSNRMQRNIKSPFILFTTVNAISQKLPPPHYWQDKFINLKAGNRLDEAKLHSFLIDQGYRRATTVREAGEYAFRGSLIDLFSPEMEQPVRIDRFGDEIETITAFDPMDQRSLEHKIDQLSLIPVSEFDLREEAVRRFRQHYRELFGGNTANDLTFSAVSEKRRVPGLDHWLPLFHEPLVGIETYFNTPPSLVIAHDGEEAMQERFTMIADYYQARLDADAKLKPQSPHHTAKETPQIHQARVERPFNPIPPNLLYLTTGDWKKLQQNHPVIDIREFTPPHIVSSLTTKNYEGVRLEDRFFKTEGKTPILGTPSRSQRLNHLKELIEQNPERQIIIACHSHGARERIKILLEDHEIHAIYFCDHYEERPSKDHKITPIALAVLSLDRGFIAPEFILFSEENILGERIARPARTKRRGADILTEMTAINEGDLIVHIDHGIGKFDGLERLTVSGQPHDCLRLLYAGGDRLFLPVENMELLSRYGSEDAESELDKLGAASWQSRKARSKKRIQDIADKLLALAAKRALQQGEQVTPPTGLWENFCAGFGFVETDDQLNAIEDVIKDLASGQAMDRLVCGDVGYGKTEIALRAAFMVAMNGLQVVMLAPTTLLARQHYLLFSKRFEETGLKVAQLSRFVSAKQQQTTRKAIKEGKVDIIIGTHALLSKKLEFNQLGLAIIDEEQHFGVRQKERLKEHQPNVHFLAMTATPIPRTLQMALSGVRDLSIIATPPVDRLAIRSFVLTYDKLVLSEAIRRERHRGGQLFYICPRIDDLEQVHLRLREELAPDARIAIAHGQMPANELETIIEAYLNAEYDILLATNIVESGLDIPAANTMIIHRADRFGLGQLYQLRGRVGRSKVRAYCYFTLESERLISSTANKRLEVMQNLDGLGAGFTLASHDMDIRGAGNLLGEAQSGHIKEVGVELYQQMLDAAIQQTRMERQEGIEPKLANTINSDWSPVLTLGVPVMLPETYIEQLSLRMALYRRLSNLERQEEIDQFAAELQDRFGEPPKEVRLLIKVMTIKLLCKQAGIERIEAGEKGALITFRNQQVSNAERRAQLLVELIKNLSPNARLRPDHKLFVARNWKDQTKRIRETETICKRLI